MSTLIYFVPRDSGIPIQCHDELVAAGFDYADPDRLCGRSNKTASGPGGQSGVLWAQKLPNGKDGADPVYDAKRQTWRKHPSGKFWVGFNKDQRPTPETLRRSIPLMGDTAVTLVDKNEWIVPVCTPTQFSVAGSSLPQVYDIDDTSGELVAKTREEFESIAKRVFEAFSIYIGMTQHPSRVAQAEQREMTPAEVAQAAAITKRQIKLAAEVLSLNYRVGEFEAIALLGLLGSQEYYNVLRAAFEADEIDAALQDELGNASASDESPIGSGSTDVATTPATARSAEAPATSGAPSEENRKNQGGRKSASKRRGSATSK